MRASIALALAALVLAGCGSSERKTVVVTPSGSDTTTVVTPNGSNTHVVEPPP